MLADIVRRRRAPVASAGVEVLTAEECRVLGCLIEKEATVPDSYPMTLNALRAACNQSTNRDPVVDYDDDTVLRALTALKERRLARFVHPGAGERATKYRHVAHETWALGPATLAVLALLLLRGPQTPAELRARMERYRDAGDDAAAALRALSERDEPLATELDRLPGQKEQRWAHLLAGEPLAAAAPPAPPASEGSADRLGELEREVAALRRLVDHLYTVLEEPRPDA